MILNPADLRFDVYTSGYNTRPLVRVTHILTGVVVENSDTHSQIRNREAALADLAEIVRLF